jgi:hypothetical protein
MHKVENMQIGQTIKIREPFDFAFPNEYVVIEINETDTWVKVEGIESAFDFRFVEVL